MDTHDNPIAEQWIQELGAERYIMILTDIINIQNRTLPGTDPAFHPEMTPQEKVDYLLLLLKVQRSL